MSIKPNSLLKKDDLISDVIEKHPQVVELLLEYGLNCATCFLNQFDTIEAGAKLHGMTDKEVDKMIVEINNTLKSNKS